ncbi:hypothetical protein LAZ67_5000217 [Cordylochernes scorpioides]|uniref:BTB domain-containing protein n=1 Tax=Cordylochernes scorpioides TaxID=51811 RepID=A0ABY6KJI0_9ARAC|nr:hypothetical protein LAZ67_5000217 [Cordylochernes scorpioides]
MDTELAAMQQLPSTHHAKLGIHAFHLWAQNNMTDITVRVGNHSFQAHKAVLTCYCPFLKRNLLLPGLEDVKGVELHNMTPSAFEVLLVYMYTGKLKLKCANIGEVYRASRLLQMREITKVCTDILSGKIGGILSILYLYVTAKKLQVTAAWAKAYRVLGTRFEQVGGGGLLYEFSLWMAASREFLELEVDFVSELLCVNPIGASSEISVFLAALHWLDFAYLEREAMVDRIMGCVRFPLMTPREILACYHPPLLPGIIEIPVIKLMLLKATCYIMAKTEDKAIYFRQLSCIPRQYMCYEPTLLWDLSIYDPFYCTPNDMEMAAILIQSYFRGYRSRKYINVRMAMRMEAAPLIQAYFRGYLARKKYGGFLQRYRSGSCDNYLPDNGSQDPFLSHLLRVPSRSVTFTDHLAQDGVREGGLKLCHDECILVFGGFDPFRIDDISSASTVLRYSSKKNKWEKVLKMPVPRHHHRSVYCNNFVYIIGGCDPRDMLSNGEMVPTNACMALNVEKLTWKKMPSMQNCRMYHSAVLHETNIFVVGGRNELGWMLATVEVYDTVCTGWFDLTPMRCPKMGMAAVHTGTLIWIIGGLVQGIKDPKVFVVPEVECYDPVCKMWLNPRPELPYPRAFSAGITCNRQVLVIGGLCLNSVLKQRHLDSMKDVLYYNQNWRSLVNLRLPAHDMAVTCMESSVYCIGGLSTMKGSAMAEVYKLELPIGRKWTDCCPLPSALVGMTAVTLPPANRGYKASQEAVHICNFRNFCNRDHTLAKT